jgi:UDP-N-acetylglucosamine 2-epimerase (non-hydrolysing)
MGPLGYTDFLSLVSGAKLVITDSGGVQEETTILGVECVTVRDNTERPVTVSCGTNRVVGTEAEGILNGCREALAQPRRSALRPPLWDGRAAERIVRILAAGS